MPKIETVALLKNLVETPSVYPNEQRIGALYADILSSAGFKISTQDIGDGRKNLFAQRGSEAPSVLFYGHQDTVPVIEETMWQTDPFALVKKDSRYYGLGASDMKGGIAAFLSATTETDSPAKIFLAVDEENISEGAWAAVKGRTDFFSDVPLIVSAESSFDLPLSGITRGRTGRAVYDVPFVGKPEHIIRYQYAVDALKGLGRFVTKLYDSREGLFQSPDTVVQVRKVSGESVGMSVCGDASAEVEALVGYGDTADDIAQRLKTLTGASLTLKPRKTPYLGAYYFESFPYQDQIGAIVKTHTDQDLTLHTRKSVGDDNVLASLGIPVITWGPNGGNEHRSNEYVEEESLSKIQRMYLDLLNQTRRD